MTIRGEVAIFDSFVVRKSEEDGYYSMRLSSSLYVKQLMPSELLYVLAALLQGVTPPFLQHGHDRQDFERNDAEWLRIAKQQTLCGWRVQQQDRYELGLASDEALWLIAEVMMGNAKRLLTHEQHSDRERIHEIVRGWRTHFDPQRLLTDASVRSQ